MFESLRKKLNIFKESVSATESELNNEAIEAAESEETPSGKATEEISCEPTTPQIVNAEIVGLASKSVEQPQQRVEPSNGRNPRATSPFLNEKLKVRTLKRPFGTLRLHSLKATLPYRSLKKSLRP